MPTPGDELSSIDFESMIGGPLIAVIHAQAQAAMSTVNFIKEVGFKKTPPNNDELEAVENTSTSEPIYVTFKYPKELSPFQPAVAEIVANPAAVPPIVGVPARPAVAAVYEIQNLEVPILTMLPIPFIRIELATIDFNAKINSVEYRKTNTELKIAGSLEAKAGWLWGSAKLKVSSSFKKTTQEGNTVDRTYSLAIHVRAVQDEMPAGMEKILGILEGSIVSRPVTQPAPNVVRA